MQAKLGLGIQQQLPPQLVLPRTRRERELRERRWKALRIGPDSTEYEGVSASWYPVSRRPRRNQSTISCETSSERHPDMSGTSGAEAYEENLHHSHPDCNLDVTNDEDLRIDINVHSPGTGLFQLHARATTLAAATLT